MASFLTRRIPSFWRGPSPSCLICQASTQLQVQRSFHVAKPSAIDMDANILQGATGALNLIQRFGNTGFTVNGHHYRGATIILSHIHLQWGIKSMADMSADSLSIFQHYHPQPEILVIGTGDKPVNPSEDVLQALKKAGITVEVQATRHACATFNFLSQEGRSVAAALLPTENFKAEPVAKRTRRPIEE